MEIPQWAPIVASLIGGGAAGAIINSLVTNHRSKMQSVQYTRQYTPVFHQSAIELPATNSSLELKAELTISQGNTDHSYENLSIVRITILNTGNKDLDSFNFGVTFEKGDKALHIETESEDRHHIMEILSPTSLLNPVDKIDFLLKPFNRMDGYSANIFITSSYPQFDLESVRLGTSHAVRLVKALTEDEIRIIRERVRSVKKGLFS